MKDFIKMTLATICGLLIVGIAMFLFSFMLLGAIVSLGESKPIMPREAILSIDLSTVAIAEQSKEENPFESLEGEESRPSIGILRTIKAINAAAADPAIKFIYLKPDGVISGLAELEELRIALQNFRKSGKAIVTYTEFPTNASYYLASVSDKILLSGYAGGSNMITGVSTQIVFLKDILDKLGINIQLIRHGKFKSAGEMYIRNSISPENRLQNEAMVESIWESIADEIAASRGITTEQLNSIIDNLELNSPEDLLGKGLVDELVTKEGLSNKLCNLYGVEDPKDISTISLLDYSTLKVVPKSKVKDKIAIIYADGEIIDTKDKTQVSGDRFASIISDVRKDSTVKAVVFRVSSPGGSVIASDKIKTEIDLLKEVKPVIASYGNYAASGGYWISNNCDRIFTNATTLTGSIGVFSIIPDFSGTLKDIAHVNVTSISSNKHSDMYNCVRPLDSKELAYVQKSVEDIYGRFTSCVAEGRDLRVSYVDSIAQGRVWTGREALDLGLVDEIGTIEDAVAYASSQVGLESYNIVEYPTPLSTLDILLESLSGSSEETVFSGTPLQDVADAFKGWKQTESGKVYARVPYVFNIQ